MVICIFPLLSKDKLKVEEERPQDVEESFQLALDSLREQDFDKAKILLEKFIYNHPNSSLAGSAHYWLGETYLLEKKYLEAALTFAEGYQKHSQSIKAPDLLYKLGETLVKLNKKTEACDTYKQFSEKFPQSKFISKVEKQFKNIKCQNVIDYSDVGNEETDVADYLSNIFIKRIKEVNELFELKLINEEEYKRRKSIILNEIDSGSLLMKLLSEKIITREDFDNRFNELLLQANETIENEEKNSENELKNEEFSIADMLDDLKGEDTNIETNNNENEKTINKDENNESTDQFTISEIELLVQQLSSCWYAPAGAVIKKGMIVKIEAKIKRSRYVLFDSVRIVDTNISQNNPYYEVITESAIRTLMNPLCTPLKLPEDKYDLWKKLTITFDHSIMKGY